jgi:hypothetical protein
MAVPDDVQNVLPVFCLPAFKILLLGISSQIGETTLAAAQAGKRFFHNLPPLSSIPDTN